MLACEKLHWISVNVREPGENQSEKNINCKTQDRIKCNNENKGFQKLLEKTKRVKNWESEVTLRINETCVRAFQQTL